MACWAVSGASIMMTSASDAAVAESVTRKPAASALAREVEPVRNPTVTSTPESRKLRACACPCEPYPMIATLRAVMTDGSASRS